LQTQSHEYDVKELLMKNLDGIIHCYECNEFTLDNQQVKYIVMEKGEKIGPFLTEIHERNRVLDRDSTILILKSFIQILQAVNNLHNINFSHRDLKLANMVLVDGVIKIIDLDSSRVIMTNISCTLNIGTLTYLRKLL